MEEEETEGEQKIDDADDEGVVDDESSKAGGSGGGGGGGGGEACPLDTEAKTGQEAKGEEEKEAKRDDGDARGSGGGGGRAPVFRVTSPSYQAVQHELEQFLQMRSSRDLAPSPGDSPAGGGSCPSPDRLAEIFLVFPFLRLNFFFRLIFCFLFVSFLPPFLCFLFCFSFVSFLCPFLLLFMFPFFVSFSLFPFLLCLSY